MSQSAESTTSRPADDGASSADALTVFRSRRQRVLVTGGVTLLGAGVVVPVLLGWASAPAGLVATIGLFAAFGGALELYRRARQAAPRRQPPLVETRLGVERTGAAVDAAIRRAAPKASEGDIGAWTEVVDRLRSLGVRTLVTWTGLTEAAARRALASGSWTADRRATSLLDPEETTAVGGRRGLLGSAAGFQERATAAIEALAELAGVPGPTSPVPSKEDALPIDGHWRTGSYRTDRWRGAIGLGLVALAASAITQTAGPALVAAVLVGMAGYASLFEPSGGAVTVDRTLGRDAPDPGESVPVTVGLTNEGSRPIADVRVVDGVPDGLAVVGGSPRHATALAPGERVTFDYEVLAAPGEHDFREAYLDVRDPSGERARASTVDTAVTTLSSRPPRRDPDAPLYPQTTGLTGNVPTDVGGPGVEFHSVREYRPGDPLQRIDWNRLARTGDLATRQSRQQQATTVVLLLDTRSVAAGAPALDALSAVDYARVAAVQLAETLLADGNRVGLATIERDWTWLGPSAGAAHREALIDRAGTPLAAPEPGVRSFDAHRYVRQLRRRLPAASQLVCLSPLLDDEAGSLTRQLHAHGYDVTLVSPDATTTTTPGATVVHLERLAALSALRRSGVRVVDWASTDPLEVAFDRSRPGWES